MISTYAINCGYLVKCLSHFCTVKFFSPIVINNYLVGRYFEIMKINASIMDNEDQFLIVGERNCRYGKVEAYDEPMWYWIQIRDSNMNSHFLYLYRYRCLSSIHPPRSIL